MTVFIHREGRFSRRLDILKRGDKKSAIAAERAEELVKKLVEEDLAFLEEAYNRTKHGELRIDKCRKYDLGSGYRLVCVEYGGDLFITYVGAHDDCDRWIENNRRFEPELCEPGGETLLRSEEEDSGEPCEAEYDEDDMDYDAILMKQIDDNLLREIFCGLCRDGA